MGRKTPYSSWICHHHCLCQGRYKNLTSPHICRQPSSPVILFTNICFQWIYDRHESHFLARGYPWDSFMTDYLVNDWGTSVKLAHVELAKADIICKDFALEAVKLMSTMSLPEVLNYLI